MVIRHSKPRNKGYNEITQINISDSMKAGIGRDQKDRIPALILSWLKKFSLNGLMKIIVIFVLEKLMNLCNKLRLSWAELSQSWGLKLGFDVEV